MLTGSLLPVIIHYLDSVVFSNGEDIALPSFQCETPWAHQNLLLLSGYWDTKTSKNMILSCLLIVFTPLSMFYFIHIGNINYEKIMGFLS